MPNKIQIRRGLKASLPALSAGEPALCTDSKEVYVGSASGNIQLVTSEIASYDEYELAANQSIATDILTRLLLTVKSTKGTKSRSTVDAGGIFTVTEAGTYEIIAGVTLDVATNPADVSLRQLIILAETGTPITLANTAVSGAANNLVSMQAGSIQFLNAGDTFSVRVKQISGNALNALKGTTARLKIRRVG